MAKQEVTDFRRVFHQAQQRAAEYYLEFARQNQLDSVALTDDWENVSSGMQICFSLRDFDKFLEYFDILRPYMVGQTNGEAFLNFSQLILEEGLLQAEQGTLLGQMAKIAERRGKYKEARGLYRKQLERVNNDDQSRDRGTVYQILSEIARLASLQADDVDAKYVLEEKLQVAYNQRNFEEQVITLYELGKLQVKIGNLNDANALCSQGLETSRRIEHRVGETDILMLQGSIQLKLKKFKSAFELYEAALHHALTMNDQTRSNEIRSQMEVLNTIMGKQIFISYSHHDLGFVEQLVNDLKAAGFSVWWDELEIKVGHSIIKKVSEGISKAAYLAIVLSPNSIKSDFVQHELETALMDQFSTKRITVLPLLITDCKVPTFLNAIKWADFRKDYQTGLRGLLDRLTETPMKIS